VLGDYVGKAQPLGVFLVGALTVLSALGVWLFALIILFVETAFETTEVVVVRDVGLLVGLGGLFLVDAVLVLKGVRIGYFLSMVLWFLTFAFNIWWDFYLGLFSGGPIISPAGLFALYFTLYPIVCFIYFLTNSVRKYFGT
jgi:hypothetical protein